MSRGRSKRLQKGVKRIAERKPRESSRKQRAQRASRRRQWLVMAKAVKMSSKL